MGNNWDLNRIRELCPRLGGLLQRKVFPKLVILRWFLKDEWEGGSKVDIRRKRIWTFQMKLKIEQNSGGEKQELVGGGVGFRGLCMSS